MMEGFLDVYQPDNLGGSFSEAIQMTVEGTNFAGRILRYGENNESADYYTYLVESLTGAMKG